MKKLRSSTVEPVLVTLVNYLGMRRVNTRGIGQANQCMLMAAVAYNLKKLLKFITRKVQTDIKTRQQNLQRGFFLPSSELSIIITLPITCRLQKMKLNPENHCLLYKHQPNKSLFFLNILVHQTPTCCTPFLLHLLVVSCLIDVKCPNKTIGTINVGSQLNGKFKIAMFGWSNANF